MNLINMNNFVFLTFFLVKLCGFSQQKYSIISKQLDSIYYNDQKYRIELENINKTNKQSSKEFSKLRELMIKNDSINVRKVQRILDKYGWLGSFDIGEKANETLFLVIQHANLSIQEKYLPLIRSAVKNKKASPNQLALLEDRIAIANGKEQIYGTQLNYDNNSNQYVLAPTFDEKNLNKRRSLVGLPLIETYLKGFGIDYKFDKKKESRIIDKRSFDFKIVIFLAIFILFIMFFLFKWYKYSIWYWFFAINLCLTIINLCFDFYRPYSLIKHFHESWIIYSILRILIILILILIIKFIWIKLFSKEYILINSVIILLSSICYFNIFSDQLLELLIPNNGIVSFTNIIEPVIYMLIYLIAWFIIYLIQKKHKSPI